VIDELEGLNLDAGEHAGLLKHRKGAGKKSDGDADDLNWRARRKNREGSAGERNRHRGPRRDGVQIIFHPISVPGNIWSTLLYLHRSSSPPE